MVLVGFVCGVLAMLPWLFVKKRNAKKAVSPFLTHHKETVGPEKSQWEQMRNFLYYDGTQMPLNKEDNYE